MTLDEIKAAVTAGKRVFWANSGYEVIKDCRGEWFIYRADNKYAIGLTHQDGMTLNGAEHEFFVLGEVTGQQRHLSRQLLDLLQLAGRCGLLSEIASRNASLGRIDPDMLAALRSISQGD